MVDLNNFRREKDCVYKTEFYLARDNGAILRFSRKGKRLRKDDNIWTFGESDPKMYLKIGTEFIHRIVATAFHGDPPTIQHVIDHIDTNRQNNRPENLRWLTKLENILNNPITVKRIVFRCGSIEAFLEDPSILKNYLNDDPNFKWMRAVTPNEARISWKRMNDWAKKINKKMSTKGNSLGEWIYKDDGNFSNDSIPELTIAETPNCVQKNWKTASKFPCCPLNNTNNPIVAYAENLIIGEIFSGNKYSNWVICGSATSKDENTLWVICKAVDDSSIKLWSLAQVTYEDNLFVHTNLGSFFDKIGAEKQIALVQGLEWTGHDSIDDFS